MKKVYSSALIAILIAVAAGHINNVVEEKHMRSLNNYSVVLETVDAVNPPAPEELERAVEILNDRLAEKGYPGAEAEAISDTEILVSMPTDEHNAETVEFLCRKGRLQFLDADGNEIMDGSSRYIREASRQYGDPTVVGNPQHYVELRFTAEGRMAFVNATAAAVAQAGEGKNYITLALDGVPQLCPAVNSVIDSDSCVITGKYKYTAEEATEVTALINSRELPFEIRPQEIK
ncbi:MAG: hypothetical protein J1F63_05970 [Oscillospiraceae bacterium]|nr:hypothetical protein [Oscillospiraceae bacterium]